MRQTLLLFCLCSLAIISTGCWNIKLKWQLRELMNSSVTLPKNVSCIYDGCVMSMPDSLRGKKRVIVFVDSTECSKCRISQFVRYTDLFRLSAETQVFVPILLLSTSATERQGVVEHLIQIELPFPVYLDVDHTFAHDNPLLMADRRFHSVVTDESGRVLLVGDLAQSEELMALFAQDILNITL